MYTYIRNHSIYSLQFTCICARGVMQLLILMSCVHALSIVMFSLFSFMYVCLLLEINDYTCTLYICALYYSCTHVCTSVYMLVLKYLQIRQSVLLNWRHMKLLSLPAPTLLAFLYTGTLAAKYPSIQCMRMVLKCLR